MQIIKKIITLIICLQLTSAQTVFAQVAQQPAKVSQQEIKVALTAPEKYEKSSSAEYIAWSIGVLAAGAIGYKAGSFIGDIKGFSRGFNAAGGFAAKDLSSSQAAMISKLEKQIVSLQSQLLNVKTAGAAEDKVIRLIVRLNSQLVCLKERRLKSETDAIKKSIQKTIYDISVAEVKDPATKRVLSKFITQAEKSLGKKSVITALASLLASAAIAAFVLTEDENYNISSSRVVVNRQLAQAFEAGPQVFTLKVLYLKQRYGLEVVSSVIYENQAKYYPALEGQLAHFKNEENRLMADLLTKEVSAAPAQHKTVLLDNIKTAQPLKYQTMF